LSRRAVIYARVELPGPRGEVLAARQVEACRRYAQECALEVVEVLVDRSGIDAPRPALDKVLEGAGQGRFDILLVRDLHALGPGLLESSDRISRLAALGVRVQMVERLPWMEELFGPDEQP
jgi:DNA invertase Pin-like site-specific DNA recombinase